MASAGQAIVYFDGVCNLCNHFVNFLISNDPKGYLQFASLQGQTARQRLPVECTSGLGSVVFESSSGQIFTHSTAALKAIAELGGLFRALLIFIIIPKLLRDRIYNFIAAHRYDWFGQRETCRLPTPEERSRFLD